jgi:hypothetical protein
MVSPIHHAEWLLYRHLIFRLAAVIASCSIVANLLPNAKKLDNYPDLQCCYEIVVILVAAIALNWRAHLPGLEAQFLGFKAEDGPLQYTRARLKRRRDRRKF